jgi:hypothetical protein
MWVMGGVLGYRILGGDIDENVNYRIIGIRVVRKMEDFVLLIYVINVVKIVLFC